MRSHSVRHSSILFRPPLLLFFSALILSFLLLTLKVALLREREAGNLIDSAREVETQGGEERERGGDKFLEPRRLGRFETTEEFGTERAEPFSSNSSFHSFSPTLSSLSPFSLPCLRKGGRWVTVSPSEEERENGANNKEEENGNKDDPTEGGPCSLFDSEGCGVSAFSSSPFAIFRWRPLSCSLLLPNSSRSLLDSLKGKKVLMVGDGTVMGQTFRSLMCLLSRSATPSSPPILAVNNKIGKVLKFQSVRFPVWDVSFFFLQSQFLAARHSGPYASVLPPSVVGHSVVDPSRFGNWIKLARRLPADLLILQSGPWYHRSVEKHFDLRFLKVEERRENKSLDGGGEEEDSSPVLSFSLASPSESFENMLRHLSLVLSKDEKLKKVPTYFLNNPSLPLFLTFSHPDSPVLFGKSEEEQVEEKEERRKAKVSGSLFPFTSLARFFSSRGKEKVGERSEGGDGGRERDRSVRLPPPWEIEKGDELNERESEEGGEEGTERNKENEVSLSTLSSPLSFPPYSFISKSEEERKREKNAIISYVLGGEEEKREGMRWGALEEGERKRLGSNAIIRLVDLGAIDPLSLKGVEWKGENERESEGKARDAELMNSEMSLRRGERGREGGETESEGERGRKCDETGHCHSSSSSSFSSTSFSSSSSRLLLSSSSFSSCPPVSPFASILGEAWGEVLIASLLSSA